MVTRTINQLHFEDLDPIRFEELILSMVYRMKKWDRIDHFGKKGSDSGIDIRTIEEGNITHFFQCKRYLKMTNAMLKNIVDDYSLKNDTIPDYYVLVVSCSLTRKQIEFFEQYCEKNSFKNVIIWTKSILEAKLYAEYTDLLSSYFGIENYNEEQQSNQRNGRYMHKYTTNSRYFDRLIKQVTDVIENKALMYKSSLKECYIDTYLTKSNDKGERVCSRPILADKVFDELVLNDENIILILGEPGQGKSTLCLWMFYQKNVLHKFNKSIYVFRLNNAISKIYDENYCTLPLIENAIYFSDIIDYTDFDDTLSVQIRMRRLVERCSFLKDSIIIFDGYDELYMHFPRNYTVSNFFDDVYEMSEILNSKIVITSRITCFPSLSKLSSLVDNIYYIDYLNLDQQIGWVEKIYENKRNLENVIYDADMLKTINEESDYKNLCELLKITLIFQMVVDSNILVDKNCNRASLYKNITTNIIHRYYEHNKKAIKSLTDKFDNMKIEEILCKLAYEIWCENDEYVTKNDEDYEKIILNCGVLFFFKITNLPNEIYHIEFLHRSFYQYYLAVFIKKEFESSLEKNSIKNFFNQIGSRVLEFDVLDLLEDIVSKIDIYVNDIIDLICKTECVIEGNLLFPIRNANNIFTNIMSILNRYHVRWGEYSLDKLGNILKYFNCYGINLSYAKLSDIDLSCCSFIGANFYHADFSKSNIRGTTFRGGNLQYADFTNAILSGADLRGTDMRNAILYGANLRGADLRGADIRGIKKNADTNLYGITISQMPEGIYRQVTKTIRDSIKKLGYEVGDDVNIIDS